MKNQLFLLFTFATMIATGVEFGTQPASASQKNAQMTLEDEILDSVSTNVYWYSQTKRRRN